MLRFGLCCIFKEQPIKFRQTTAKALSKFDRQDQLNRLSEICLANTRSVKKALQFVSENRIGAFRISTPLFPRYTHPEVGYSLDELPAAEEIKTECAEIRAFRNKQDIRLSLHPDQFNVLSSPRKEVVSKTVSELEYQGMLAELFDVEIINIHAGGSYGNKPEALDRLKTNFQLLSDVVVSRLTLENDDVSYTPADLLPVCDELNIPFVYDIHHHRCLQDVMSEEEATRKCIRLWKRSCREADILRIG
jgi:UV DNA damage endonuclease